MGHISAALTKVETGVQPLQKGIPTAGTFPAAENYTAITQGAEEVLAVTALGRKRRGTLSLASLL